MALLLRPANVLKNTAATFTIDYNELAALSKVPAGYYKTISNWKTVSVRVKNKASGQRKDILFTLPSTEASLLVSDTARAGTWEVYSMMIRDYDRGEVVLHKEDISSQAALDFFVVSPATHGDLIVNAGQEVILPANGTRQYGDFIVEAGGTIKLADGGGILEVEVLGNCVINGQILANNGKHTGGTWSKVSGLSENLSFTITQKAGGNGGAGESTNTVKYNGGGQGGTNNQVYVFGGNIVHASIGDSVSLNGVGGYTITAVFSAENYFEVTPIHGNAWGGMTIIITGASPAGVGGLAAFGNGGGGGRSSKFIAQAGDDAIDVNAGAGAGISLAADEYGEDGLDSTAPVYGAGGGFRGAHGQAIYIKARQIQGSGVINASGQMGGNGGDGGEYLAEGELYANGAGGGAAGGDGGKVWLRVKKGTPVLTVNTLGGERGTRGISSPGAVEAAHGTSGSNGSFNLATY